jgi:hypothetical protein
MRIQRGYEMRRFVAAALVLGLSLTVISCGGKEMVWDNDIEQSTFTEIEQGMPEARQALVDLGESLEKVPRRDREAAMEQYTQVRDFVEIVALYYLPILNARAHISRAYREIQHGMYQEASDDIRKAIDNLNKASLKSTESTQAGFEVVKNGLTEVGSISDASAEAKLVRLSNAAKQLNTLIEQIRPMVVVVEEDGQVLELLIDGQL